MANLLKTYFGNAAGGTLGRLQYLGYSLTIGLVIIVMGIAFGVLLGVSEHLVGGKIQEAQEILRERFSTIFLLVLIMIIAGFGYALINIMAKRIRDIGLPAWPVTVAIIVISGSAAVFAAQNVQQGFSTAMWLALLLIPSGAFGQSKDVAV